MPVIQPFTTLIVLIASHPVCGLVLTPFLGKTSQGVYNWVFVIGIVLAALWVVISWYVQAAPMFQQVDGEYRRATDPAPSSKMDTARVETAQII